MLYPDPTSRAEWRTVGIERGEDADALRLKSRLLGSLYMYGYEAECYAKGLISGSSGKRPPYVHTLMELIVKCGVRREHLTGDMQQFVELHDVTLRYQSILPLGLEPDSLDSAVHVCRFLYKMVTRHERKALEKKRTRISLRERNFVA